MEEKQKFIMTGVSQITVSKKWVWRCILALVVFFIIVGTMLVISATSRPATVNSGGYTNGVDW